MAASAALTQSIDQPATAPSLFHHPDFVLLVIARAGMMFGLQFLNVAVGWHVYQLTENVLHLGLIGLFQFLPVLLLFLVAGLVADRIDRRLIIGICNLVHVVVAVSIGLYLLSEPTNVWPIFLLLVLHGAARGFEQPALQAILPNVVPRELFTNAVAVSSSVTKIGQLGGPAVGGVVIAVFDEASYFAVAALFGIAAIAAFMIRTRLRVSGKEPFGLITILGGFRHIWREKIVLASISIDLMAVLFGGIMGLLPVFAADILNVGPEILGLMRGMPAMGALMIALVLTRIQLPWHIGRTFFISLTIFGLSITVFSVSSLLWLSLLALAIYGAADMVSVYVRQTLVQLKTPDALRGRVSSVNAVSINASNELGDFRAGAMAAVVGTVPAVAIGAGMTLLATALWWHFFPQLRRLERI